MEKAKDKVTANGNPSGIATTIIEIHKIIISKMFLAIMDLGFVKLLLVFPKTFGSSFFAGKLNKK